MCACIARRALRSSSSTHNLHGEPHAQPLSQLQCLNVLGLRGSDGQGQWRSGAIALLLMHSYIIAIVSSAVVSMQGQQLGNSTSKKHVVVVCVPAVQFGYGSLLQPHAASAGSAWVGGLPLKNCMADHVRKAHHEYLSYVSYTWTQSNKNDGVSSHARQ